MKIFLTVFIFSALLLTPGLVKAQVTFYCFCETPAAKQSQLMEQFKSTGTMPGGLKFECIQKEADKVDNSMCTAMSTDDSSCYIIGEDLAGCEAMKEKRVSEWQVLVDDYGESDTVASTSTDLLAELRPQIKTLNKLGTTSMEEYIARFISVFMGVIGSLALVMIIYGGVMWMTAAGNAEREKKALEILVWSGLGVVLVFASYALVNLIFEAFR